MRPYRWTIDILPPSNRLCRFWWGIPGNPYLLPRWYFLAGSHWFLLGLTWFLSAVYRRTPVPTSCRGAASWSSVTNRPPCPRVNLSIGLLRKPRLHRHPNELALPRSFWMEYYAQSDKSGAKVKVKTLKFSRCPLCLSESFYPKTFI